MNQELELVESMDKLSDLMRKFQTQLRTGDLKEYTLRQLYYIELIDKNQGIRVSELSKKIYLSWGQNSKGSAPIWSPGNR